MPHDQTLQRQIETAQQRLDEQKALLHQMITQGTPTQAAEDRLLQLEEALALLQRRARSPASSD
jgi:hypothetical protein